ncbi:MAG: hypothetical protein HYW78_01160 [Parcubacteria group bacterium]|nr:hypothetical protein [Parcubacteria group bacterium]
MIRKKKKMKIKAIEEIVELKGRDATIVEIEYGDIERRRVIRRNKKQCVALKDACEKIKDTGSFMTPLLPPGTKYYIKKKRDEIFVIEIPPQVRTVLWKEWKKNGKTIEKAVLKKVTLAFPFIILVINTRSGIGKNACCFYRTVPLQGIDDLLYHSNLENVYSIGSNMCLPLDQKYEVDNGAVFATFVINSLWNGIFTDDLSGSDFAHSHDIHRSLKSVEAWEKATKKNPLFVLDIPWIQSAYTVRGLIDYLMSRNDVLIADTSQVIDLLYRIKENK